MCPQATCEPQNDVTGRLYQYIFGILSEFSHNKPEYDINVAIPSTLIGTTYNSPLHFALYNIAPHLFDFIHTCLLVDESFGLEKTLINFTTESEHGWLPYLKPN